MSNTLTLPMLPLRDVVVYPNMVLPLFVGRKKSIAALDEAMDSDKLVFLVAQKDATKDEPEHEDLYQVGTVAKVIQLLRLPDGTVKVLVEGQYRATHSTIDQGDDFNHAVVVPLSGEDTPAENEYSAIRHAILKQLDEYVAGSKRIPSEVVTSLKSINDLSKLIDSIAGHMSLKLEDKQQLGHIVT